MPQLVLPSTDYQDSFLAALAEFQAEDLPNYNFRDLNVEELRSNFGAYVEQVLSERQGLNLPLGYVPHTVWWLVKGPEYLGRVDIRHQLNEQLLKLGGHIGYSIRSSQRRKGYGTLALKLALEKARELGLHKVLVTCDIDNIGSNKIIQANGGVLENTVEAGEGNPPKNRYWITLPV